MDKVIFNNLARLLQLAVVLFFLTSCESKIEATRAGFLPGANGTAEAPTFSLSAGTYNSGTKLELTTKTLDGEIYYTTDGEIPTEQSAKYTTPITLLTSQTIKALTVKTKIRPSTVVTAEFVIVPVENGAVSEPVATPADRTFNNTVSVTLSAIPLAATIYYSTDGSIPSIPYTGAIELTRQSRLKAKASLAGYTDSTIMDQTFTFKVADPGFSIPQGTYGPSETLSISSATTGASLHYTVDGSSEPTCASASGPITLSQSMTVKAIGCNDGYTNSEVVSANYTINGAVDGGSTTTAGVPAPIIADARYTFSSYDNEAQVWFNAEFTGGVSNITAVEWQSGESGDWVTFSEDIYPGNRATELIAYTRHYGTSAAGPFQVRVRVTTAAGVSSWSTPLAFPFTQAPNGTLLSESCSVGVDWNYCQYFADGSGGQTSSCFGPNSCNTTQPSWGNIAIEDNYGVTQVNDVNSLDNGKVRIYWPPPQIDDSGNYLWGGSSDSRKYVVTGPFGSVDVSATANEYTVALPFGVAATFAVKIVSAGGEVQGPAITYTPAQPFPSTPTNGFYDNACYAQGLNTGSVVNGTGFCSSDGLYYVDSIARPGLNSSGTGVYTADGKYYINGILANGFVSDKTVLLLHMDVDEDGDEASTTFTDSSPQGQMVTPIGNAKISTSQSKFGGASAYFDGSSELIVPSNLTEIPSGMDFTIEAWIYPTSSEQFGILGSVDYDALNFAVSDGALGLDRANHGGGEFASSSITTNVWQHVAAVRSGNTARVFVDGDLRSEFDFPYDFSAPTNLGIGHLAGEPDWWANGYIDEVRITKGLARYTSNFTPPSAAFEPSDGSEGCFLAGVQTNDVVNGSGYCGGDQTYYIASTAMPGLNSSGTGMSTSDNKYYVNAIRASGFYDNACYVQGVNTEGVVNGTGYCIADGKYYVQGIEQPGLDSSGTGSHSSNGKYYVQGIEQPGLDSSGTGSHSSNGKYYQNGIVANGIAGGQLSANSNTVLLLHMDGQNGSSTFLDSSSAPKTLSPSGNVTISGSRYKFGGGSASFDGSSYLNIDNPGSELQFSGAFTMETWANISDPSKSQFFVYSAIEGGDHNYGFGLLKDTDGRPLNGIGFFWGYWGHYALSVHTTYVPAPGEWHHYAVSRDADNNWRFFIDGVITPHQEYEENYSFDPSMPLLGSETKLVGYQLDGYLDELRITKSATYTTNFTPSSGACYVDGIKQNSLIGGTGYCSADSRYYSNGVAANGYLANLLGDGKCEHYINGFRQDGEVVTEVCSDHRFYYQNSLANGQYNGTTYLNGLVVCGASGNSCYNNAAAISVESAVLSDGTQIDYVAASGNFKVWKETGGNRILKASGLWSSSADWQKKLTRGGIGFAATNFTLHTTIAGRACPTHVFLDYTHMTETNLCLYYDQVNQAQTLNQDQLGGVLSEDYLPSWNQAGTGRGTSGSWYEGNIKTCADKGMRLPTLYETSADKPTSWLPQAQPTDASPVFGGSRVPLSGQWYFTASAAIQLDRPYYWLVSDSVSSRWSDGNPLDDAFPLRCVLP